MSFQQLRLGLERGVDGRSLAWALDFPGAFAYGKDDNEALEKLPESFINYRNWFGQHIAENWVDSSRFEPKVVETLDSLVTDDNCTFNAFFEDDRRPLEAVEILHALKVHTWQRQELLDGVRPLSAEVMTRMLPGQRWNINGILNHIGRTEFRYLVALNLPLPPDEILVHNPYRVLELSFEAVQKLLPKLEGDGAVLDRGGEFWSARKLLRHLLWHQRDHIDHIRKTVRMASQ